MRGEREVVTKNILELFQQKQGKEYLKITKNKKSFIVHLYIDSNGRVVSQPVIFKEATIKDEVQNKEKVIQEKIKQNPDRVFLEPNGKTLGIIAYKTKPITLPSHIDDYAFMTPKETFDWLLLRSIGL